MTYKINDEDFYLLAGQFRFRVSQGVSQMSASAVSSEGLTRAGGSLSKVAHSNGCHSHAGCQQGPWCFSKWAPHRGDKGPAGMTISFPWKGQSGMKGGNCNPFYDLGAEVTHCHFRGVPPITHSQP